MKVQKRTFLNKEDYERFFAFLKQNSQEQKQEYQIVSNFRGDHDFRIITTKDYVKLDLKTLDRTDQEYQVLIHPRYLDDLIGIYQHLGMVVTLKRYRIRNQFIYQNFFITLDDVHHYGYVLRVMKESDQAEQEIMELLEQQKIPLLPTSEFNERFTTYRLNWPEFTKDIQDESFIHPVSNQ